MRKPKKPVRREPPAWEVYRLKSSPAAFVGLVYAEDEETAIAVAIEEHNVRPADQSGYLRGRARKSAGEADARTTPNSGLSLSEAVRHSTSPYSNV